MRVRLGDCSYLLFPRSSRLPASPLTPNLKKHSKTDTMPILMPALSPTMEEGAIVEWAVKVGDEVEAGDVREIAIIKKEYNTVLRIL